MSTINSHDYTYQQVGWSQSAEVNTGIHDYILHRATFAHGTEKNQPNGSRKSRTRGITRSIQGLLGSLLS